MVGIRMGFDIPYYEAIISGDYFPSNTLREL